MAREQRCAASTADYLDMCFGAANRTQECDEVVDHVLAPLLSKLEAVFVCMDGIEQCDDDERALMWNGISRLQKWNPFKMMVASRDDMDLSEALPRPTVRVPVDRGLNTGDIRAYIDEKLLKLSRPDQVFGDEILRQEVKSRLMRESGGM